MCFGRNALIEGDVPEGKRTLLVEDLTTDGQSKIKFAQSLRDAGAFCNHAFVVFFYGVFAGSLETLAENDIALLYLATWWDVLEACRERPYFPAAAMLPGSAGRVVCRPWRRHVEQAPAGGVRGDGG
jgi:orotate phosphoribosyltransferase